MITALVLLGLIYLINCGLTYLNRVLSAPKLNIEPEVNLADSILNAILIGISGAFFGANEGNKEQENINYPEITEDW